MNTLKTHLLSRNKFLLKAIIVLVALLLFALLTKLTTILAGTDDAVLSSAMHHYSILTWVPHQYVTWSGRVTAESLIVFIYTVPTWVWKVLELGVFCLLIITLYHYYTLIEGEGRNGKRDLAVLTICAFSPLLISDAVLRWGAFWITGSLNYLWIATLALIAFYPLLYTYIHKQVPRKILMAMGVVTAVLAALGQEQAYLILSLFSVGTVGLLFLQTRKVWLYPSVQALATVAASAISYAAPGNRRRLAAEMQTYIPTFHSAPILHRIDWSYRWFIDAIINHTGYILPIVFVSIAVLLCVGVQEQPNRVRYLRSITICLLVAATIASLKITQGLNVTNFYVAWGVLGIPKIAYLYLLFWTAVLAATLFGLFEIAKRYYDNRFILPLLFLWVMVDAGAMILSPTMYASGPRTMLVPSVLSLILVVLLLGKVLREYWKYRIIILSVIVSCSLITFVALVDQLSMHFRALGL